MTEYNDYDFHHKEVTHYFGYQLVPLLGLLDKAKTSISLILVVGMDKIKSFDLITRELVLKAAYGLVSTL